MTHSYSAPVTVDGLQGWAMWDCRLQSYALVLRLFDSERQYPPPFTRHGTRVLEYPTIDALTNDMAARGLTVDNSSFVSLEGLTVSVEEAEGVVEVVGLIDADGRRRLYLVAPSGLAIELLSPIQHADHGLSWGDRSPATYDTARIIMRCALAPATAAELDLAALALTVEFLSGCGVEFSLSAPGLCHWQLADTPLVSTLDPAERRSLRRRFGLGCPPRSLVEEPSAAAAPAGTGGPRLDRHP